MNDVIQTYNLVLWKLLNLIIEKYTQKHHIDCIINFITKHHFLLLLAPTKAAYRTIFLQRWDIPQKGRNKIGSLGLRGGRVECSSIVALVACAPFPRTREPGPQSGRAVARERLAFAANLLLSVPMPLY